MQLTNHYFAQIPDRKPLLHHVPCPVGHAAGIDILVTEVRLFRTHAGQIIASGEASTRTLDNDDIDIRVQVRMLQCME